MEALRCILAVSLILAGSLVCDAQNNLPPEFNETVYAVSAIEQLPPGPATELVFVTAYDIENDPLEFYIDSNSLNSDLFGIQNVSDTTAYVYPLVELDRESHPGPILLQVYVTDNQDHGENVPDAVVFVIISLQDINDERPEFDNLPASVSFREDVAPGNPQSQVEIYNVDATDDDIGTNSRLVYVINSVDRDDCSTLPCTGGCCLFKIEVNTGIITLAPEEQFDFDVDGGGEHELSIIATDNGEVPLSREATLTVVVEDFNDLNPTFDLTQYTAEINESLAFGTPIIQVFAYDQDRGIDDTIIYSIISGNGIQNGNATFVIDVFNGTIYVNVNMLDREDIDMYTLTIQAEERNDSSRTDTTIVTIRILDINDHTPIFTQLFYNETVPESAEIGRVIITATAFDLDQGSNADFTFTLVNLLNGSLPFTVSSNETGQAIVRISELLDFEQQNGSRDFYRFTVVATELFEAEVRSGFTEVTVQVTNVNDLNPEFVQQLYQVNVSESAPPGTFLITAIARDEDRGTFGDVRYYIFADEIEALATFNISGSTGVIETAASLDFETTPFYDFVIIAEDLADIPDEINSATALIQVTLININDNPPVFVDVNDIPIGLVLVEIDENSAPQEILQLRVLDADGDLNPHTFEIISGNELGHFVLNGAALSSTISLDYDFSSITTVRSYQLLVQVNDTASIASLLVDINLLDLNDNSPIFENDSYIFTLFENEAVGTLVGVVLALDIDSEELGDVVYSIVSQQPDPPFVVINETTGEIFSNVITDREELTTFTLVVMASDRGSPPGTNTTNIRVDVLDQNDNVPRFNRTSYRFSVNENEESVNFAVSATDRDIGPNGMVFYDIISGNTDSTFEINLLTGVITRNASVILDYEDVNEFELVVVAYDGGVNASMSTVPVVIDIEDLNDNTPQFIVPVFSANISEDIQENTIVIQLQAVDEDSGDNGRLVYTIISISGISISPPIASPDGSFTLEQQSGIVRTVGTFNREAFAGPYSIVVMVQDNGIPSRNSTSQLLIRIDDANDLTPVFMNEPYSASIMEGLPPPIPVVTLEAVDGDLEGTPNAIVTFSIVDVFPEPIIDPFYVDPTTGEVFTAIPLDFENVSSYRITVQASDQGPMDTQRSSNSFVTVSVIDINDQQPEFTQDVYVINATENTPVNTRFAPVLATDRDQGTNAAITYTANITIPFGVDPDSGQVVLTASLDFEAVTAYMFEVTATDGGVPQFEDRATVIVNVLDANDHSPQFDQVLYLVNVPEGNYTIAEELLTTVFASDLDSGVFAEVRYEVFPADDVFYVDAVTGELFAAATLDREIQDFYTITIVARDGGMPANTATARVEITVEDVNDNAPVLDRVEYSAVVREDSAVGLVIATVSASDDDIGANGFVGFSIDDTINFAIDTYTGVVTTNRVFDFESVSYFTTTIRAFDNVSFPLEDTAVLTVNISDFNDNPPVVVQFPPAGLVISENATVGSTIFTVIATDVDSGSNGELVFQLANDEGRFSVDVDGLITIIAALDFERTPSYNLTVTVSDRGQPQMAVVNYLFVMVDDINDNPPVFERDDYSFLVPENLDVGDLIGAVVATDLDVGPFGNIMFELDGPDALFFAVFPTVMGVTQLTFFGEILNGIQNLDYETRSLYSLRVSAQNTEPPFHIAYANITIIISDINDNTPVFSQPKGYTLAVPESTPTGTAVGTLVATDEDGGLNGTVVYSFAVGTDSSIIATFGLDPSSGVINLTSSLNFEMQSQYSFAVVATDLSVVPLSSLVQVTVNVVDNNEEGPVFDSNTYTGSVLENVAVGSLVGRVNATEGDAGGSVTYRIVAGASNRFQINPITGIITTSVSLDREDQERYILTVEASDLGDISLASFAQVDVTVLDANDNNPVFDLPEYNFRFSEEPELDTVLATITATDRDAGTNADILYSLTAGSAFQVEPNTGVITVVSSGDLDREITPSVSFMLRATDQGSPALAGIVTITVELLDINDNSPEFSQDGYTATVLENSGPGVSVVTVEASDEDGDGISYRIVSGDDPAPKFFINAATGLIETTFVSLDYELLEAIDYTYTLTVEATDIRASPRPSITQVVITVEDINDNVPQCPSPSVLQFSIQEAQTLEVRGGTVTATDEDSGNNAVISYSIVSGDASLFRIEQNSGILFGSPDLDFESTPVHILGIEAIDSAADPSNRLSATCTVTVTLIDINDNPPVFSRQTYDATVIENATIGSVITSEISATDIDSGANALITYSLQSSTRVFVIDENTGVVTLTATLDADNIDRYDVDVEASDGDRIGRATLVVRVLDVDDTRPVFDRSFYVQEISEGAPPDSSVITLTASDRDSSVLFYNIIEGNADGFFKIESNSGLIETANTLDREQVAVFTLVVLAVDAMGNNGSTTLQVTILDVNDEAPQFLQPSYTARVVENSPTGTQVLPELNGTTIRIEAVDADQPNTQNSRVLYRLEGDDADQFNINFDTGIMSVALGANLDREARNMLTVIVVASDSVPAPDTQFSTVVLTIVILDENDLPPMFTQPFGYSVPVNEALIVGSLVTTDVRAMDPDSEGGGVVRYSITNASPLQAIDSFSIDFISGDITLERELDREADSIIILIVTASDQGVPARSSVVSVQITVSDANDNAPEFAQDTFTTTVPELQGVGQPAFTIVAEDPDLGLNAVVMYRLLPTAEPFNINPVTGVIATTAQLDHEVQDSHTVTVEACDSGSPPLCSQAIVVFIVIDFNDELPMFDLTIYRVDIVIGTLSGTPLVQPVATDADSGTNSVLTYSLRNHFLYNLFIIDTTTGLISLINSADDIAEYSFEVVAEDNGDTPLSGSAEVVIRVVNATAQDFMFIRPYFSLEMDEGRNTFIANGDSTTQLQIVPVTANPSVDFDPDYSLNPFQLTGFTNFIGLKPEAQLALLGLGQMAGLDREVRELYTVIVRAQQNFQSSYTSVTVRVLDLNDNTPEFVADLYVFSVTENMTAPVAVGAVLAEDRDAGTNAEVSYLIASIQPTSAVAAFVVDNVTGVISTAVELDRENIDQYTIIIQASDGVGTDTTEVIVEVQDTNDCVPTFDLPEYNAPILENLPAGASVTTVAATDCDAGLNAVLSYTIVDGNLGFFQLDSVSGAITTLATLDFEVRSSYYLQVQVADMGRPIALTSLVDVNIQVQDFNDCPPEFVNPPTSMSVLENATINSVLVIYEISDCDSGLNGPNGTRFTIIAGNVDSNFEITEESGSLLTLQSLDREVQDSYLLSIQVRDSAGVNSLSSVTQLTVVVLDVNDNDPVFISSAVTRIVGEGEELSTELVTVQATDADSGLNGMILYSLEDDFGIFRMDDGTGALSLINSLDHELTDGYDLVVIARDRGAEPRSSNATISIIVRDENDNAPVISNIISGVTSVDVLEGALFVTIFTVMAQDLDSGSNGEITFSLTDSTLPFTISSSGGAISVSGVLDYETQNEYTLVVTATDQGSQQLSGIETLTVRILDENDNNPEFQQATYEGSQFEGSASGTSIVRVTATDADQTGSINAVVEYSIMDDISGDSAFFSVNSDTGVIFNTVPLDRESTDMYFITVVANNSLSLTARTSTAMVVIQVLDVNDETPEFLQPVYNGSLSELAQLGSIVLTVSGTDGDEIGTPNSELIYLLPQSSNNPFHMDPNTGELTLQNTLDFEQQAEYNIDVTVEDKGSNSRTGSATITVYVDDENDQPPQFVLPAGETRYRVSVSESVAVFPFTLAELSYSDADNAPINRSSTFSIDAVRGRDGGALAGSDNPFRVTTDSAGVGTVTLTRAVDHESRDFYELFLDVLNTANGQGELCGSASPCVLRDSTTLELTIVDENDNIPIFDFSVYTGEVSTSAPPGTAVLTVRAVDNDSGNEFGTVNYRLENSGSGRFRIDEETGTIFTRGDFADLDGFTYTLIVVAFDNNGNAPSNSNTTEVNLVVLNDFQRVRILFQATYEVILQKQDRIEALLRNVSGYDIVVEDYADFSTGLQTNFIFHAIDPVTNEIVDFDEFSARIKNNEEYLFSELRVCNITIITPFADIEGYVYPDILDTQTIVILVLCLLLILGAIILLGMSLRQRYLALHDTRHKLLADVFYHSPASGSMVENIHHENYTLEFEMMEHRHGGDRQNPVYLKPYAGWSGMDTESGLDSGGDASSLQRDNVLYESQELRMELFADMSEGEADIEADDDALLAAALHGDEDDEDTSVTAI